MAKRNLLGDCVLRRGSLGELYLMNRQEGGWRSALFPVKSEETLLDEYNVRLGEWTKDECSEYCLVTRIPRSELPTLHDGERPSEVETFPFDDIGPRGETPIDPNLESEAFRSIREVYEFNKLNLLDDSFTREDLRELLRSQHDIGPRGTMCDLAPTMIGVGGSLAQTHDRDPQAFAQKMNLTAEQANALAEQLVPVFADGEIVDKSTLAETRSKRILAEINCKWAPLCDDCDQKECPTPCASVLGEGITQPIEPGWDFAGKKL